MNDRLIRTVLWGTAAVALAAGVGLTAGTLRERGAIAARLARKLADLSALQTLQAQGERHERMVAAFEGLENPHPESLPELVKSAFPGETAEVRGQEPKPVIPGWTARRAEVNFSNVRYDRLAEFIAMLESKRPPWRVMECAIRASRQGGDVGQVRLALESLDKTK